MRKIAMKTDRKAKPAPQPEAREQPPIYGMGWQHRYQGQTHKHPYEGEQVEQQKMLELQAVKRGAGEDQRSGTAPCSR